MTDLVVAETGAMTPRLVEALHELWNAAFAGDFGAEDAEHAFGGVHAMIVMGEAVLAHASAVPRTIQLGERPFAAGYVEAVATDPSRQGQGLGRRVMLALQEEMGARFELGVLSTGAHGFYEGLGWERWRGPSYVLRDRRRVRSEDEDDGLMVLRFDSGADLDLSAPIACHDRPGDAW